MTRYFTKIMTFAVLALPNWALAQGFFGCPNGMCPPSYPVSYGSPYAVSYGAGVPYGSPIPQPVQFAPRPYGASYSPGLPGAPNYSACPSGNCPTGICTTGTCVTGNCPTGLCPTGNCPTGNCPTGFNANCPNGICPAGGNSVSMPYNAAPIAPVQYQSNYAPQGLNTQPESSNAATTNAASPFYTTLNNNPANVNNVGVRFTPSLPSPQYSGTPVNYQPQPQSGELNRQLELYLRNQRNNAWSAPQPSPGNVDVSGLTLH